MAAQAPVLWQFAVSHYAEKARWALDYKHVPHIRRSLMPGPHVRRIKRMTGQTAVPVLELGGAIISDSTRIIEAIEKLIPTRRSIPPTARRGNARSNWKIISTKS